MPRAPSRFRERNSSARISRFLFPKWRMSDAPESHRSRHLQPARRVVEHHRPALTQEIEPQPLLPIVHAARQTALDCDLGYAPRHARLQTLEAMLLAAYIKLATRRVCTSARVFRAQPRHSKLVRRYAAALDSADATRVLVCRSPRLMLPAATHCAAACATQTSCFARLVMDSLNFPQHETETRQPPSRRAHPRTYRTPPCVPLMSFPGVVRVSAIFVIHQVSLLVACLGPFPVGSHQPRSLPKGLVHYRLPSIDMMGTNFDRHPSAS